MGLFILLLLQAILTVKADGNAKPNVVFLLIDDLGYNDVGYHDPSIATPVLTRLASEGIIIENNYVAPLCGPSRSALLTGRYNFRMGLQNHNIEGGQPACLTKENLILPEALKLLGYNNYMLGKWGMGFCNKDCTPTYRGFDEFHGYHAHFNGHYNHENGGFYDFWDGLVPDTCSYGKYCTELLGAHAGDYIENHVRNETTRNNPFFMYFAFQTVHGPFEAPLEYLERHNDEPDPNRRIIKAMISLTDDVIGRLVQKLKDNDLYNNTIIILSYDNGGDAFLSSNYPLRGAKESIWEGGVRVPGFVHSPLLKGSASKVSYGLFHQTDWFPTIISLAGGTVPDYVDGFDQSDLIMNGGMSVRSVVPIHYDNTDLPELGHAAIRSGNWKLMKGFPGGWDGYGLLRTGLGSLHPTYDPEKESSLATSVPLYENSTLLFDLEADPHETTDLAAEYPEVVQYLETLLQEYAETAVDPDPNFYITDPLSNPELYGNIWFHGWC